MKIYNYSGVTGEFLLRSEAREDPKEVAKYLIPANATELEPPITEEGFVSVFENGGWVIREDHRGETIYDTYTGEGSIMVDIGPIPASKTILVPPKFPVWDGSKWTQEAARIKAQNAFKAKAEQQQAINTLMENNQRKALGIPPSVSTADEATLEEYVKVVQADVDNPSEDEIYTPPLPPGVTPPAVKSLAVNINREAGWQGHLGFRVELESSSPDYVPTNLALSIYSAENCTNYLYTTGAFQHDTENGKYFAICPPGHEPGDVDVHMGLLYGAAQLSCFTLPQGVSSKKIYAYEEK